ncbi:MAG TPA: ABC transporter substrate-binding protein [Dongiaceae bacterium]|jgi:taurine transport system substrate-binding protein|nr:ABC transporter substrate-binding protein [Dongiaceae bacterium]
MSITRRTFAAFAVALGFSTALASSALAEDHTITIAYQTGFSPFVRAIASGEIATIPGWKVEFREFNSGAEIFAAIAAGDVQIGDVGSSPFAASVSKGIDVKAVYISGAAGQDEALVVRNGSGIETLADLKGKRLAAAPVSTDHFMLLSTLKQEGIGPNDATVLAIPQPEIVAGWQRGDIDAAFVWDPALGKLQENGKVLLTAKQAADRGAVTFGALVATGDLIKEHSDFVQQFVTIVDKYYRDLETHPENWAADSDNVKVLAKFTGAKPQDIADRIKVSAYVPAADQASTKWLGGGEQSELAHVLHDTAEFLKGQQKINQVLDSYAAFIDPRFVQATLAAN